MLVTTVVNNAQFPVDATFTSHGGSLVVQFAGSAYSPSGGKMAVKLKFGDRTVATATVYTNEPQSHKALVPVAVGTERIAAGEIAVTVEAADANTTIDGIDYFTVTVFEFDLVTKEGTLFEGFEDAS